MRVFVDNIVYLETTNISRDSSFMKNKQLTVRLTVLNFLEFAVWGAYLTSLGRYLGNIGLGNQIKWFFAMQGIMETTNIFSFGIPVFSA